MSKKLDEVIIELARFSPLAWTVQTELDQKNLCDFVKTFALDAIYDNEIQKELKEVINIK